MDALLILGDVEGEFSREVRRERGRKRLMRRLRRAIVGGFVVWVLGLWGSE